MKDIEDWICFRCKHYQKRTDSQNAEVEKKGLVFPTSNMYCLAFPYGIPDNLEIHDKIRKRQSGLYIFDESDEIQLPEG